jgi:hypothetical protein
MTEYHDFIATVLVFSVVVTLSFILGAVSMALWFIKGDE